MPRFDPSVPCASSCCVLQQVMNLLGAGPEARLSVTRSLRQMTPPDREWLLSITYTHLQDSYRRRAVPEMCMILNEIAGADHFTGLTVLQVQV